MPLRPDRPVAPLGSARHAGPSIAEPGETPAGEVWLLDDASAPDAAGALAVAERLGVGVRRVPLVFSRHAVLAAATRRGSLFGLASRLPLDGGMPALTLSGGPRARRVALWLKRHAGSRLVHVGAAGFGTGLADLHVTDSGDAGAPGRLPVLGRPHRVSPLQIATARAGWRERLAHLPHPRLALMVGGGPFGGELQPSRAFAAARALAEAVSGAGGAILAVVGGSVGREATDALAAGMRDSLHLLHRAGAPDADAALGFLASCDVAVVAGDAQEHVLHACAGPVPVYILDAGPVPPRLHRLHERLIDAGHIRRLDGKIQSWRRPVLDEAGRAATVIAGDFLTDQPGSPGG